MWPLIPVNGVRKRPLDPKKIGNLAALRWKEGRRDVWGLKKRTNRHIDWSQSTDTVCPERRLLGINRIALTIFLTDHLLWRTGNPQWPPHSGWHKMAECDVSWIWPVLCHPGRRVSCSQFPVDCHEWAVNTWTPFLEALDKAAVLCRHGYRLPSTMGIHWSKLHAHNFLMEMKMNNPDDHTLL